MLKFVDSQKKSQELRVSSRVDDDGDVCLEINGQVVLYIDSSTGKLHRMHNCDLIEGIELDDRGRLKLGGPA